MSLEGSGLAKDDLSQTARVFFYEVIARFQAIFCIF